MFFIDWGRFLEIGSASDGRCLQRWDGLLMADMETIYHLVHPVGSRVQEPFEGYQ